MPFIDKIYKMLSGGDNMIEFGQELHNALVGQLKKDITLIAHGLPNQFSLVTWHWHHRADRVVFKRCKGDLPHIDLIMYPAGFAFRYDEAKSYFDDIVKEIITALTNTDEEK